MTESTLPVAGESALLADRYIGALFALAKQDGVIDAVLSDMQKLQGLWNESSEWRAVATNPCFSVEFVSASVDQVIRLAELHKLTANFLKVVAQNRRLKLLPVLIRDFVDETSKWHGEFHADVRTARPLGKAQSERLAAQLSQIVGGDVRLVLTEDPSIIGGMTVKIGSKFIDASVKTRLDKLENTLRKTSVAA